MENELDEWILDDVCDAYSNAVTIIKLTCVYTVQFKGKCGHSTHYFKPFTFSLKYICIMKDEIIYFCWKNHPKSFFFGKRGLGIGSL